jgi:hypothetical protein
MADQAGAFVHAREAQTCLQGGHRVGARTPGMGGFSPRPARLPGQARFVGVLDLWDAKGYVTADEFRR